MSSVPMTLAAAAFRMASRTLRTRVSGSVVTSVSQVTSSWCRAVLWQPAADSGCQPSAVHSRVTQPKLGPLQARRGVAPHSVSGQLAPGRKAAGSVAQQVDEEGGAAVVLLTTTTTGVVVVVVGMLALGSVVVGSGVAVACGAAVVEPELELELVVTVGLGVVVGGRCVGSGSEKL